MLWLRISGIPNLNQNLLGIPAVILMEAYVTDSIHRTRFPSWGSSGGGEGTVIFLLCFLSALMILMYMVINTHTSAGRRK